MAAITEVEDNTFKLAIKIQGSVVIVSGEIYHNGTEWVAKLFNNSKMYTSADSDVAVIKAISDFLEV